MTSIDDWKQLKEEFLEHFGEEAEASDSRLRYEKAGEFLEIRKGGIVEAGMPLHANRIEDADSLKFGESEVEVFAEDSNYVFRR